MARVTVEDCTDKIPNRFELVMAASQRARAIGSGSPLMVDRDRDKNTVVSLREIAEEKITPSELEDGLIRNYQRAFDAEDTDDSMVEEMTGEMEWAAAVSNAAGNEFAMDDDDGADLEEDDLNGLETLAGGADEEE